MTKRQYTRLLNLRKSEESLFKALVKANLENGKTPRETIRDTRINHKRACYLLEKFADRKEYEYGVSLDLGWFN